MDTDIIAANNNPELHGPSVSVRPSVYLSVCHTGESVKNGWSYRITQHSPQSSPMTLVSSWLTSPRKFHICRTVS